MTQSNKEMTDGQEKKEYQFWDEVIDIRSGRRGKVWRKLWMSWERFRVYSVLFCDGEDTVSAKFLKSQENSI